MFRGKLNAYRSISLLALLAGFLLMYGAILLKGLPLLAGGLMVAGFLFVIGSGLSYFLIGALSMRAVRVVCPTCGRETKMLGMHDRCLYCGQRLTLDPCFREEEKKE
ncbi:DUF2614 family zinc ribbon-containing protein [Hydrogenibacillus sp. N12]|uniref:DUF2614 family zinc ribbon-containing protein n=1 Tax=Hydrogenibacillus sp. N12 TaxID=2866627 RepID=UPI001C7DA1C8|nr:DUF2614 family zinc ribbon-containing protein [Hydrogenibacillus sp. N12]QZA33375.1 hypothetical protein K2M58_02110 [Hydrogenibacillus sp. N12]